MNIIVDMNKSIILLLASVVFFPALFAQSQTNIQVSERKSVSVYVRNDTGDGAFDKMAKVMENTLSARINNVGFSVISHDLVVRNLNDYLGDPNAQYRSEAETLKRKMAEGGQDSKIFESASGLRLAQMIGADYILSVSISTFGKDVRKFEGNGISTHNTIHTLRCNYNLFEGGSDLGTAGDSVKVEKTIRQSAGLENSPNTEFINAMLEDAAEKMAKSLKKKVDEGDIIAKQSSSHEVAFVVSVSEISFPQLAEEEDGTFYVSQQFMPLTMSHVTAEIDGVTHTISSSAAGEPIKVELAKGLHTIKITHKDLEPFEKTINVTGRSDQVLAFDLQMNEHAKAAIKKDIAWIQEVIDRHRASAIAKQAAEADINARVALAEAEAARLRGIAKMCENSGFNVKVDVRKRLFGF